MKKNILLLLLLAGMMATSQAQTLMTVGDQKVQVKEFKRMYEKNNTMIDQEPYTRENLDSFKELYSLFLMKLQEAKAQQLDTGIKYKREMENYKKQIADRYQKENQYLEDLLKEAYKREQNEWNVSHIMMSIPSSMTEDSIKAKSQLEEIKREIGKGQTSFEDAAAMSVDKATAKNGGKVGWVTSLQLPYALEDEIVKMQVGEISDPVYSPYGVHLLKINAKRPNFGQIKVAQILLEAVNTQGSQLDSIEAVAMDVYSQLKSGKITFEDAVLKYSQDPYSNSSGGELEWFGPGKNVDTFENAALAMKVGDISKPVYTSFGFHIIKKLDQKPLPSYDERRDYLRNRIQYSPRGQKAKEYAQEKMRKDYKVIEYDENLVKAVEDTPEKDYLDNNLKPELRNRKIFSIQGKDFTYGNLYDFSYDRTKGGMSTNIDKFMLGMYQNYLNEEIQKVYMEDLIENNEDYKNLVKDYGDGILIFDLMQKNLWGRAAEDSAGLREYYEGHRDRYTWGPSVEYDVYTSSKKDEVEKLTQVLGKINSVPEEALSIVRESYPSSDLSFVHERRELDKVDPQILAKLKSHQPTEILQDKGKFVIYIPNQFHKEPGQKSFTEAKSYVSSDYQKYLEQIWNEKLKEKYTVKLNDKVYQGLIRK